MSKKGGSDAPLLVAMARSAPRELFPSGSWWTLQHRHPDEGKWFVIGHFPSKQLAEGSAKAFVSADGPAGDFHVHRLRAPAD
jgi:hypothetical protein